MRFQRRKTNPKLSASTQVFRNKPTVLTCNTLDIGILFSVFSVSVTSVFYGILSQYFSQLLLLVVLCMPISARSVCELFRLQKCHFDIIKMTDGTLGFKLVAQCRSAKKHKQNCILLFGKRGPPNVVAKRQEITGCQSGKAHTVCNQLKHFVDPNHKIKRKIIKQT